MSFGLGGRDRVEGLICVTSNRAGLLVQRGFPNRKTERMLYVDEGLALLQGNGVIFSTSTLVVVVLLITDIFLCLNRRSFSTEMTTLSPSICVFILTCIFVFFTQRIIIAIPTIVSRTANACASRTTSI